MFRVTANDLVLLKPVRLGFRVVLFSLVHKNDPSSRNFGIYSRGRGKKWDQNGTFYLICFGG